jgi:nucleotide-binding universal stress UspA family protein
MAATGIVVGVDGSAPSRAALRWAATEARRRRAPLRVLLSYEWPWLAGPVVVVRGRGCGSRWRAGARSSHRYPPLLGSVGLGLLYHADCPVLIAHRPADR